MKHFKKMMALIIALVMVVGTMSMGAAFGAPTPDTKITITGLDAGDTVNLYQVLKWEEGTGWVLADGFKADNTVDPAKPALDVANINKLIANQSVELTREDLEAITTYAKTYKVAKTSDTVSGTSFEKTVNTGLYLALVAPKKAGVVYNPIVVSADFDAKNKTNSIDASTAMMGSSSVAKKKKVTVDKSEDKITNNIGDTYSFTIKTTIPLYSDSFKDTFFNITDEVTKYLAIDDTSIKINGTSVSNGQAATANQPKVTASGQTLEIEYNDAYIKALTDAQDLVITYDAKLTISKADAAKLPNAEVAKNEVTVRFPNNPNDDKGRTVLKDGTRERTFTIDGKLRGHEGWQNSELVKVGKKKNGEIELSEIAHSNGIKHKALDGAVFGLFKTEAAAKAYTGNGSEITDKAASDSAGFYNNDVFLGVVSSENGGLMYIPGLDAGTYYLKELTAPTGYIKDQDVHTVKIEVTSWLDIEVTEYYIIDGNPEKVTWYPTQVAGSEPYTYTVRDVDTYKVTIDGHETEYNMDLSGPYTSTSSILKSEDAEIANTEGVELPSTGGIGTTVFYVIGAILVLGAGVLLVTRRRMSED